MIGNTLVKFDDLSLFEAELVDAACDRFEMAWRTGGRPRIENYQNAVPESCRVTLLHELIQRELELRVWANERPTAEEYRSRFPDQFPAIVEFFDDLRQDEEENAS
jgi:serine/threonine-protein kinase